MQIQPSTKPFSYTIIRIILIFGIPFIPHEKNTKEGFAMIYKCSVCGYEYDEEKEGKPFSELTECPICKQPPEKFRAFEPEKPVSACSAPENEGACA